MIISVSRPFPFARWKKYRMRELASVGLKGMPKHDARWSQHYRRYCAQFRPESIEQNCQPGGVAAHSK